MCDTTCSNSNHSPNEKEHDIDSLYYLVNDDEERAITTNSTASNSICTVSSSVAVLMKGCITGFIAYPSAIGLHNFTWRLMNSSMMKNNNGSSGSDEVPVVELTLIEKVAISFFVMYVTIFTFLFVIGLLGMSLGVPVKQETNHNVILLPLKNNNNNNNKEGKNDETNNDKKQKIITMVNNGSNSSSSSIKFWTVDWMYLIGMSLGAIASTLVAIICFETTPTMVDELIHALYFTLSVTLALAMFNATMIFAKKSLLFSNHPTPSPSEEKELLSDYDDDSSSDDNEHSKALLSV